MKKYDSIKKSVMLAGQSVGVCQVQSVSTENIKWSESINSTIQQYLMFVDDNTPELTNEQWDVFYRAYKNHTPHSDIAEEIKFMSFNVLNYLGSHADESMIASFAVLISRFTKSQALAVIYKSREYWSEQRNEK